MTPPRSGPRSPPPGAATTRAAGRTSCRSPTGWRSCSTRGAGARTACSPTPPRTPCPRTGCGPKIAAISDPGERAAFVNARLAEQRADINLLRLASELVVDSVVEPAGLRAELIDRLADAAHWTRGPQRRHHHISPV
jgi:hypothetical protein